MLLMLCAVLKKKRQKFNSNVTVKLAPQLKLVPAKPVVVCKKKLAILHLSPKVIDFCVRPGGVAILSVLPGKLLKWA
jgi:hypothetical protein